MGLGRSGRELKHCLFCVLALLRWSPPITPVSAVYIEHATGVMFTNLVVSFVGVPKTGNEWGSCVEFGNATSNVTAVARQCRRGSPP